ncbi:hypothetical protein HAX54_006141 [Datura stramonium]|uniref:Uncharacterized protein n=1 Tax=Datura stramonium TaxID=4076 RepID=A0ABS8WXW5_DATST|nr:hypothetical protein [Datura stramonium]
MGMRGLKESAKLLKSRIIRIEYAEICRCGRPTITHTSFGYRIGGGRCVRGIGVSWLGDFKATPGYTSATYGGSHFVAAPRRIVIDQLWLPRLPWIESATHRQSVEYYLCLIQVLLKPTLSLFFLKFYT